MDNNNELLSGSLKDRKKISEFECLDSDIFDARIYECPNLRRLIIQNTRFASMPDGIAALKKLYSIEIENTALENLPNDFGKSSQLNSLTIINSPVQQLPANFYNLLELRTLLLEAVPIELDAKIIALRSLEILTLKGVKISTEIVAKLPQILPLVELTLSNIGMTEVPKSFTEMRNLYYLDISHNPITTFPKHILQMPRLLQCKCDGVAIFHDNFKNSSLNAAFYTSFYSSMWIAEELRYNFYLLFSGDASICMDLPLNDLLWALFFSVDIVQATARAVLMAKYADMLAARPLQKDCFLVVLGATPRKKPELKQLLAKLNIQYANKPDPKATHILLGTTIQTDQISYIVNSGLPCLFPQQLERFFESQNLFALSSSDTEVVQHLEQLFASLDEANIVVGLQLMQTNGVPKPLVTDLFLASKNQHFSLGTRRQALRLLKLNASETLLTKLKSTTYQLDQYYFHLNVWAFYLENTELDAHKMVEFAQKYIAFTPKAAELAELLEVAPRKK